MDRIIFAILALVFATTDPAAAFEREFLDKSPTSPEITFIGHGTLMFRQGGKIIHVDPWTELADYRKFPKADLILITHEHRDHLDLKAIETVRTPKTVVAAPEAAARQIRDAVIMRNGDTKTLAGFTVEAVPAYNIVHMRSPGVPYHPKGVGNGYIIRFDFRRVYIAGDTENTPEMKALIDRAGFVSFANGHIFKNKVGNAAVALRRTGASRTADSMIHFFLANEMIVSGFPVIGIGREIGEVLHDEEGLARAKSLGQAMAQLLNHLKLYPLPAHKPARADYRITKKRKQE